MTKTELNKILELHSKWLVGKEGGERADLRGANLIDAELRSADLNYANLRGANLRSADLIDAELRYSDLSYANLRGANLRGADLSGAIGNGKEVKSLHIHTYTATYTFDTLAIGCQQHKIVDWWKFSDDEVMEFDEIDLSEWKKGKKLLRAIIKAYPAIEVVYNGK